LIFPTALFDLLPMPIYLGTCFLFHFWIGVTALRFREKL
jgi:ABC-type protease/lipase transport system fused ATPase/permease subunit